MLGFIGSFYAYEGLDLLLRALPTILLQAPDIALLLTGGGEWVCGAVDEVLQAEVLSRAFCHPLKELRDDGRRYFVPA